MVWFWRRICYWRFIAFESLCMWEVRHLWVGATSCFWRVMSCELWYVICWGLRKFMVWQKALWPKMLKELTGQNCQAIPGTVDSLLIAHHCCYPFSWRLWSHHCLSRLGPMVFWIVLSGHGASTMSWCTPAANINQWPLVVGQPTDFETDLFNFDLTLPGLTSNLGLRAQESKQGGELWWFDFIHTACFWKAP